MQEIWSTIKENIIYIILGIFAANILILNYFVFIVKPSKDIVQNINLSNTAETNKPISETSANSQPIASSNKTSETTTTSNSCPNACQTMIKNAISSITPIVITSVPTQTSTTSQSSSSGGAQEFFVPLGSASGASQGSFTTLPALSAYVNMSQYSNVQTVTFEVSATIPNGNQNITVQLYDATDGYAIANSQLNMSGGTPQLLISQNLNLPSGNKLYQVQINTQLNSPITIDQARLHITTN